jgi:hypothetical protein
VAIVMIALPTPAHERASVVRPSRSLPPSVNADAVVPERQGLGGRIVKDVGFSRSRGNAHLSVGSRIFGKGERNIRFITGSLEHIVRAVHREPAIVDAGIDGKPLENDVLSPVLLQRVFIRFQRDRLPRDMELDRVRFRRRKGRERAEAQQQRKQKPE